MCVFTAIVVLVFCLQYGACVALYHANERRTEIELLVKSGRVRASLKIAAWGLLVISVFLCATLQGWERGVPVWLCLVGAAGFVSLYVSAYKPTQHVKSGVTALILALFFSGGLLLIEKPQKIPQQVLEDSTT